MSTAGSEHAFRILLLDNFDSYSYNLYHGLAKAGCEVCGRAWAGALHQQQPPAGAAHCVRLFSPVCRARRCSW